MKFYKLSFDRIIWRFYLMMAVVVGSFIIGVPALAILSLPIFLSAIMGVKIGSDRLPESAISQMNHQENYVAQKTAA